MKARETLEKALNSLYGPVLAESLPVHIYVEGLQSGLRAELLECKNIKEFWDFVRKRTDLRPKKAKVSLNALARDFEDRLKYHAVQPATFNSDQLAFNARMAIEIATEPPYTSPQHGLDTAIGVGGFSYQDCLDIPNGKLLEFLLYCDKDPTDPKGYRLIAFECCMLKILTFIIDRRICEGAEDIRAIPKSQNGIHVHLRTNDSAFVNGNIISGVSAVEMKLGESVDLIWQDGAADWGLPSNSVNIGTLIKAKNTTPNKQYISVGTLQTTGKVNVCSPSFMGKVGSTLSSTADFHPMLKSYVNLRYVQNEFIAADISSNLLQEWNLAGLPVMSNWLFGELPQGGYSITSMDSLAMVKEIETKALTAKGLNYHEEHNDKESNRKCNVGQKGETCENLSTTLKQSIVETLEKEASTVNGKALTTADLVFTGPSRTSAGSMLPATTSTRSSRRARLPGTFSNNWWVAVSYNAARTDFHVQSDISNCLAMFWL
ncbi:hypothetical protein B0H13DRAFT_2361305 [Mycena leptocephala]|nr:hypothetical protein B0H13DRAFT_2361305 [Mycena leptocephala]